MVDNVAGRTAGLHIHACSETAAQTAVTAVVKVATYHLLLVEKFSCSLAVHTVTVGVAVPLSSAALAHPTLASFLHAFGPLALSVKAYDHWRL